MAPHVSASSSGRVTATTSITCSTSSAPRCCSPGWPAPPMPNPIIALGVLIGYPLVAGEVFLATTTRGIFRISVRRWSHRAGASCSALLIALPGQSAGAAGPSGRMPPFDFGGLVVIGRNVRRLGNGGVAEHEEHSRGWSRESPDQTAVVTWAPSGHWGNRHRNDAIQRQDAKARSPGWWSVVRARTT